MAGRTPTMISTAEAAARLGVTRETLYAYVSRGRLRSHLAEDGRSSRFDAAAVEAFRARRRGKAAGADLTPAIVSSLTRIHDHHLFYRGVDAVEAARDGVPFESIVARLVLDDDRAALDWRAPADLGRRCRMAQQTLPDTATLYERLQVNLALASAADPLRDDRRPLAVARAGARALATMVDGLPRVGRRPLAGAALAERLWSRLTPTAVTARWRDTLNAALVVLADHDLAASTFAARVAASTRANPYAVIAAGMGALRGPLHGTASHAVVALLHDAQRRGPAAAVGDAFASDHAAAGWGHFLYPDGDPRAGLLFDLAADASGDRRTLRVVEEVGALMGDRLDKAPNIDFALAAFAVLAGLADDATSAIFAIARSAGWLGHAVEEYSEAPLRFRPRARYIATR